MAQRVAEFDTWKPTYGGAAVSILIGGTSTLADVWLDVDLTVPATNPQVLQSQEVAGVSYGKFTQPVYVGVAYQLSIDEGTETGLQRQPITSLDGEDASDAHVTTARGNVVRDLVEILDNLIHVEDFGVLEAGAGGSATTNTTTLNAAIGAAANQGGGRVRMPAGTYKFTTLSLSAGVVLEGEAIGATILQSTEGEAVVTVTGSYAGLRNLTLDGSSLVADSIGVAAADVDRILLEQVRVMRFVTGIQLLGGVDSAWTHLWVSNCTNGVQLHSKDAPLESISWNHGGIDTCTAFGLSLLYEDDYLRGVALRDVFFDSNTGVALLVEGARATVLNHCRFEGNSMNLDLKDGSDTSQVDKNTVIGFSAEHCRFDEGELQLDDSAIDVRFTRCRFEGVAWDLQIPNSMIVLEDPSEDAEVTVTGDSKKLGRTTTDGDFSVSGVTTDATETVAWEYTLAPGEVAIVEIKVLGNRRDGTTKAIYHYEAGVYRAGSTLAYDAQTANFAVGQILTGATSGATARIIADSDSGATGTLTLRDIVGEFEDNEVVTDGASGSATANGTLTAGNATVDSGGVTALRAAFEDVAGWAATISASGQKIRATVTGAASTIVEWTVHVRLRRS